MFANVVNGTTAFFNTPLSSSLTIWELLAIFILVLILGYFVMDTLHHFNSII